MKSHSRARLDDMWGVYQGVVDDCRNVLFSHIERLSGFLLSSMIEQNK